MNVLYTYADIINLGPTTVNVYDKSAMKAFTSCFWARQLWRSLIRVLKAPILQKKSASPSRPHPIHSILVAFYGYCRSPALKRHWFRIICLRFTPSASRMAPLVSSLRAFSIYNPQISRGNSPQRMRNSPIVFPLSERFPFYDRENKMPSYSATKSYSFIRVSYNRLDLHFCRFVRMRNCSMGVSFARF